jgi:heme-degrading monooxygenase HmoA
MGEAMLVILFRSRLTAEAGQDYQSLGADMEALIRENPGYLAHKYYQAEDGERLTLVWFRDAESLKAWREFPPHAEAQRRGRERWYESYTMEVAQVVRTSKFQRSGEGPAEPS